MSLKYLKTYRSCQTRNTYKYAVNLYLKSTETTHEKYFTENNIPPIKLGRLKIKEKYYKLLNGDGDLLVEKVSDGSIISRFDKTPYPVKKHRRYMPALILF